MHKMCKNIFSRIILLPVLLIVAVSSCTTIAGSGQENIKGSDDPMYYGEGRGDSALKAMTAARRAAAASASYDLLDIRPDSDQAVYVDVALDGIADFSPYVYMDSQQTIEGRSGEKFYYLLGIRINLDALAGRLIAAEILGGQIDGRADPVYRLSDQKAPAVSVDEAAASPAAGDGGSASKGGSAAEKAVIKAVAAEVTTAQLEIISRYIDDLAFMVYYDEEAAADPRLTRSAVVSANRFLNDGGREWIELSSIEKIKEEQTAVYEQETGHAVSIIQWIAHKMNADIYIEISLDTSAKAEGRLNLKCYNAETFKERGSASVSIDSVAEKTVAEAVSRGMKAAVAEAEQQSAIAASHGFRYSLIMTNTPDPEIMKDFAEKLESGAESVKRTSFSAEKSVFEVYLIGDIADLEDLVYYTAKNLPGMEGVMLVMQRRNSIIFDSGM